LQVLPASQIQFLRGTLQGECLRRTLLRRGAARKEAMTGEPFGHANEPGCPWFYPFRARQRYPTQCPRLLHPGRGMNAPISWYAQLLAGRNCIICQMTAPRTRLPSLSFPDETDSHSAAQPPKRGVGLQAQSITQSLWALSGVPVRTSTGRSDYPGHSG